MALQVVKNPATPNNDAGALSEKAIARIEVDRDLCIGAESCAIVAPDAFYMDDENIAVVKEGALKVSRQELMEAAQACPVAAIIYYDDQGNQIYP